MNGEMNVRFTYFVKEFFVCYPENVHHDFYVVEEFEAGFKTPRVQVPHHQLKDWV